MVRPIIEYASSVWDPYTSTNTSKLESIQRRAARYCFDDFSNHSSVTKMLSKLNLPLSQARRSEAKLLTFYKIINGYFTVPIDDLNPKLSLPTNDTNRLINFPSFPPPLNYGTNSLSM